MTSIYNDSSLNRFFIQVQDKHLKRIAFSVGWDDILLNRIGKPYFFFLHFYAGLFFYDQYKFFKNKFINCL